MTLGISRSGFYAYCNRGLSDRALENEYLAKKIREVFDQHRARYGAKRIGRSLQDEGIKVNRKRVVKLMRTMGLYAKGARRAYKNYNKKHSNRAWANVLQQDFTQDHWNKVWLGDITYVPTHEGSLYLVAFLDLCTRKIVGWLISSTMTEQLVIDAFVQGFGKERPAPGLIVHTDQGAQFTGGKFTMLVKSKGTILSNSSKGNP